MKLRILVALAALISVSLPANAQNAGRWENAVFVVASAVIQDIEQDFLASRERETWQEYADELRRSLEGVRNLLDPVSFQIMLEIHRQLEDDFTTFDNRRLKWQDAQYYVQNKMALVSFTLSSSGR